MYVVGEDIYAELFFDCFSTKGSHHRPQFIVASVQWHSGINSEIMSTCIKIGQLCNLPNELIYQEWKLINGGYSVYW